MSREGKPAAAAQDDWREGIRLGLRLATAHHPLCTWFKDDRYHWGRIQVCRGCAAAIPTFVLGLIIAVAALLHEPAFALHVGGIGLLFGIPHGTTYLHRFPPAYRATAKLTGGLGLGLLITTLLLAPIPPWQRIFLLAGFGVCFLVLQGVRMKKILATCDACPWRRDWARCPGFQEASR